MSSDSKRVQAVFLAAVEVAPAERAALLARECGEDRELRQRVEALLKAHDEPATFLESPSPDVDGTIDMPPLGEGPGTVIGPYKLMERVGEGGMGVVFVAEQQEPVRRKVALKIIKPGMDTKEVIARFEAERQALALMDHPNIARVFDAGATESGRPYFVMELVRGIPITDYCDKSNLTTGERLELFLPVCHAIQHAHQKGIIHRDVKPTNVMVTLHDGTPVPKIIDFGVAKAISQRLTERTVYTRYAQMVGTPLYMSPEQAEMSGLDVDTRSDVYSLGVLLYELLTGTTPFDKRRLREAAYDELLRIIREEEPPKPSTRISSLGDTASTVSAHRRTEPKRLGRLLRGELDWIVMKALEKDRTRRYETANGFAADVQRYLSDEPVVACPPSAAYRFKKFARRNRAAFVTASLVTAALVFGMIGTAWQAIRATQAEGDAKTERDIAQDERNSAVEARGLADERLVRAQRAERAALDHLASSYVDHAQALCEQGEIGRGMLWYAHSLQNAPDDAADLRRAIRMNLAAWKDQLHSLSMLVQHEREVRDVALSPDGSRILATCEDGSARLWAAATGRPIAKPLSGKRLRAGAFCPDGSRIALWSQDGLVYLCDAATLEPLGKPLDCEGLVKSVAFRPDGSQIITASVSGEEASIRRWDGETVVRSWATATGAPLGDVTRIPGNPHAMAYCTDGRVRVAVSRGRHGCQLFDGESGEAVGPAVEHTPAIKTVAISPDGSAFATASLIEVCLWDAATGELAVPTIVHGGGVYALTYSPDGSRIASGGNAHAARLWEAATGQPIGVPMRHRGTVRGIAFSSDGNRILTGSEDGAAGLWDLAPDRSIGSIVEHKDRVLAAGFGPDGLRILTVADGVAQLRSAATGEAIGQSFADPGLSGGLMFFSPDGSRFVIHEFTMRVATQLRDVATGEAIGEPLRWMLIDVAFSPDGSRIIVGSQFKFAQLLDAATLEPLGEPLQHPHHVRSVEFSPDGSRIVTASQDGTVKLWDAATLAPVGGSLKHPVLVERVDYGPEGRRLLMGCGDWTVRLWDVASRQPVGTPMHHQNLVGGTAISPDGSRLFSGSVDGTARIWDAATLKPIGPPLEHDLLCQQVSFSPDGAQLLQTEGMTGRSRLWDAPPGPIEGDQQQIVLWTQVVTGLELDSSGGTNVLDGETWQDRNQRLTQLGGPPARAPLPPPVQRVETDFSRTMHLALSGRDHAEDGRWDEAAAAFSRAIDQSDNSPTLRRQIAHWCGKLATTHQTASHQDLAQKASDYATALFDELESEAELVTPSEGGWVPIFDGKTLNGWKANMNKDRWTVEDGAIVVDGPHSHLFYVGDGEPFVNFELLCEVMTTPGASSGIHFHTTFQESGRPERGCEAQVNVSDPNPRKTGSLWGEATVVDPPCRDNEYWTHHIIVQGKRVIIAINGKKVLDYIEPEGKRVFAGGVRASDPLPVGGLCSGTFALCATPTNKVYFKNIRVKRLP